MRTGNSGFHSGEARTKEEGVFGRGAGGVLLLLLLLWLPGCIVSINPGQAGVFWDISHGTDTSQVYREGVQIIAPWNEMYIYDLRTQEARIRLHVLSLN